LVGYLTDQFGRGSGLASGGLWGGLGGNQGGIGSFRGGRAQFAMDAEGGTKGLDGDWYFPTSEGTTVRVEPDANGDPNFKVLEDDGNGGVVVTGDETIVDFGPTTITGGDDVGDGGTPDSGDGGTPDSGDGGTPDSGDGGTPDSGDGGTPDSGDNGGDDSEDDGTIPPGGADPESSKPAPEDGGTFHSGKLVRKDDVIIVTRGGGCTNGDGDTGGNVVNDNDIIPGGGYTDYVEGGVFGAWGGYNPPMNPEVDPVCDPIARTVSTNGNVHVEELTGMTTMSVPVNGVFSASMMDAGARTGPPPRGGRPAGGGPLPRGGGPAGGTR
jgi:hypothetical protein